MPSSNGVADARAKVKRLADAGVDVIKLIDHDLMTMEEVRAVVDEAHKRLRVSDRCRQISLNMSRCCGR